MLAILKISLVLKWMTYSRLVRKFLVQTLLSVKNIAILQFAQEEIFRQLESQHNSGITEH